MLIERGFKKLNIILIWKTRGGREFKNPTVSGMKLMEQQGVLQSGSKTEFGRK